MDFVRQRLSFVGVAKLSGFSVEAASEQYLESAGAEVRCGVANARLEVGV